VKRVMAGVAIIATLALTGCASQRQADSTEDAGEGVVVESERRIDQQKVTLSDGTDVYCLFWRLEMECFPAAVVPE
jgi:hypothetical protein